MSKTSDQDKKAARAIKKARRAVKAAQKATRTSSKKLQNQAAQLKKATDKLAAKNGANSESISENSTATRSKGAIEVGGPTAVLTPPLPEQRRNSPTLIELREQARIRKISGYSGLNKTELLALLG